MLLPPAFQSLFSFHLGCGYARKKNEKCTQLQIVNLLYNMYPFPLQTENVYQRVSRLYVGMAPTGNICNTQKPYNFTTNMLKAYLSTQPSSLSTFMISKTKPRTQAAWEEKNGLLSTACACAASSAIVP